MLTAKQLRQKYLDFFVSKGHKIIPSASLIPENDPTVLFTTAGMHPLVPFLLGEKHPEGKRLASVQKCIRTQDIDEVGDNRHQTFFEMMGNWSLGDYFKKETIEWSFEFLTDKKWLGLDIKKLAVSVFAGDPSTSSGQVPRDVESAEIWKKLGIPENKIAYLPRKNNWWGPAGQTGPCGPDTEMFWWQGESEFPPEGSNPGTDEDNWLEIWNDVFMQYNKQITVYSSQITDGEKQYNFVPLEQKNVDTGMGLERTLVVLNGYADVFQVDTFKPLIDKIEELSGVSYAVNPEFTRSIRIVADHIRTAVMIMGDDKKIAPSNVDQGYVVRRLIRRAVRHGRTIGIKENFCSKIAEKAVEIFKDVYPEVARNRDFILTEISGEESKFRNTVEQGLKEFEKLLNKMGNAFYAKGVSALGGEKTGMAIKQITGKQAFKLYDTFGFPLEMTLEMANENGLTVDVEEFHKAFHAHQEMSRVGAEQKFKGGLADHSEISARYHTATHLLHAALREVLGSHVEQRGSNITAERLRFDFSHPEKMTNEQKKRVEELINYSINRNYPVIYEEMSVAEAKAKGAMGLFEDKYGSKVKVYSIGDTNAKPEARENSLTFSREICGGPHAERTGLLGRFKIIKEEAVSAGVRRIKGVLE